MPLFKIKKAEIRALRGISTLELPFDGKSILLKGENGAGKSSIIEGLEFFFTGKITHLEHTQGISLRRHAPHVNFKAEDMEVSLTFDPGDILLRRTLNSSPVPPSQMESFFQESGKGTFILRRSQILEFISSMPSNRFVAIGSIMGLAGLDEAELEMMKLRDELAGTTGANQERMRKLFAELTKILDSPTNTLEEALQNLNRIATEYGYPPAQSLKAINKYARDVFKGVKGKVDQADEATKLNELVDLTKAPAVTSTEIDDFRGFAVRANDLISRGTSSEMAILEFLQRGKGFLESEGKMNCPFCQQEIDREDILRSVEMRILTVSQLATEASDIRRDSVGMISRFEALRAKLDSLLQHGEPIRSLHAQRSAASSEASYVSSLIERTSNARDLKDRLEVAEFDQHAAIMNECFAEVAKRSQALLEKVELTEEEKRILKFVQLLGSVKTKVSEIAKLQTALEVNDVESRAASLIYDGFSKVKKELVQATYTALQSEIQRYFERLHPEEPPRRIQLQVFASRRASTRLMVDTFSRTEQDPRAFESEGHLDSLGICIFLAFVRKFNENCPLLILDDVVATIDAGHRQRLADLLLEEFGGKQLIVTTHDAVWFEQFRAAEKACKVDGNFKNLEITSWDVNTGPRIRGYRPLWEGIEDKIKLGDKVGAGNECRNYLEWILENLCEDLQVPVPFRRDPRYQVSDLFSPARKRTSDLLSGSGQEGKFETVFINLEKTIFLGNWLSHNNVLAPEISIEEVKFFFASVRSLHLVFSCPDCGGFISYKRDLQIMRCSNPKCGAPAEIRLHR